MNKRRLFIAFISMFIFFGGVNVALILNKIIIVESALDQNKFSYKSGVVKSLENFNGKDTFKINGDEFEISYNDIQCISGENLVWENREVILKYIKVESLIGNYVNKCIIEIN